MYISIHSSTKFQYKRTFRVTKGNKNESLPNKTTLAVNKPYESVVHVTQAVQDMSGFYIVLGEKV